MVSDSSSLIDGDIAEKLVGWDHSFFIFLAVLLGGLAANEGGQTLLSSEKMKEGNMTRKESLRGGI